MTSEIGVFEAKTHLSELLARVESGEEITITRRGQAIARLVPALGHRKEDVRRALDDLRNFSKGRKLGGLSWRKLRDEGRKW